MGLRFSSRRKEKIARGIESLHERIQKRVWARAKNRRF